jgi:ribonuclease BN (tRNA processing enzyme)
MTPERRRTMHITFLGTNGWYDTDTGNTVCILIRSECFDLVLDAGTGFAKLDRFIPAETKRELYLFLSHFHLDHIMGLHTLAKFTFPRGLSIWGPEGTHTAMGTFINTPFSMPIADLSFDVELHEIPADLTLLPFPVEARPLQHASLTLGYRFTLDGKMIAYCPDTGYCENAVAIAQDADFLIAECAFKSGENADEWPHLNPETAARIAREGNVKKMALVHFDAERYQTLQDRKEAETIARKTFEHTVATLDGMEIDV